MTLSSLSVGIIIPTLNGAVHLKKCLPPLLESSLKPKILIIDSASSDSTLAIAKSFGIETFSIPLRAFNHGSTREIGRRFLRKDIVVMLTQDAYLTSSMALQHLVLPLIQGRASISYARQLPHLEADFFASFARDFNYPLKSHIRGIEDQEEFGAYTFFCSNSCAAYLNSALDSIGGFPHVLFGEDTAVVAKLLHTGHKIAYVSEAEVYHSHTYTLYQELARHFDIGFSRSRDSILRHSKDSKRGQAFLIKMLKTLIREKPHLLPYALAQTAVKFLGYHIGKRSLNAPLVSK